MGRYKEKLRATKQALKFITEELEAREVEVVRGAAPHFSCCRWSLGFCLVMMVESFCWW